MPAHRAAVHRKAPWAWAGRTLSPTGALGAGCWVLAQRCPVWAWELMHMHILRLMPLRAPPPLPPALLLQAVPYWVDDESGEAPAGDDACFARSACLACTAGLPP